eukprot:340464-Chlamydomonas_euryale.AAC.1
MPQRLRHDIAGVRLTGGETVATGRLEVYVGGRWGTVCRDMFDRKAAAVVCSQLFPLFSFSEDAATVAWEAKFLPDTDAMDIVMDDVQCRGTEVTLQECGSSSFHDGSSQNCHHAEDVGKSYKASDHWDACTSRPLVRDVLRSTSGCTNRRGVVLFPG